MHSIRNAARFPTVPTDVLALFDLDHTLLPHDSDEQWVTFLSDRRLLDRGRQRADFRDVWTYCDSLNDLPLLSRVSHPVAFNADPVLAAHARHRGWPIVQFA